MIIDSDDTTNKKQNNNNTLNEFIKACCATAIIWNQIEKKEKENNVCVCV